MCVPVQFVTKSAGGRITHFGGSNDDGSPWGLSVAEGVARIDNGEWSFFVEIPKGTSTPVITRYGETAKYLTTAPDNTTVDNLGKLPLRSPGIAGIEPNFPLDIPGPIKLLDLVLKLRKLQIGVSHKLVELFPDPNLPQTVTRKIFGLTNQQWNSTTPLWFYATCRLPFPAVYEVFVNTAQINGEIDPAKDGLVQIAGDDIIRRQQIEQAGGGWFSWDLTLKKPDGSPDPSAPERFSEIRIVFRPQASCWQHHWFRVYIRPSSLNRYCSGLGTSIYFEVSVPIMPPPVSRPAPTQAKVPKVTGLSLSNATTALGNAGFNTFQVIGPSTGQLQVDAQSPSAGDTVAVTTTMWLSVSDTSASSGFSKLQLHNVHNRQKPFTIHSFDYVTGQWKDEGTVDYDDTMDVDLDDGHTFGIYAVDPTMPGCRTGEPTEADCVPWQALNTFTGDSQGPAFPIDIV